MEFHDRLRLFNRKAELLTQRSFFAHMVSDGSNVGVKWDRGAGWESSFTGPDDESIEASVLTIRQFMQNNDPISIHNVAEAYVAAGAPEEVLAE
jgi:malonyl CoA-acyl carrier protein transacylase